MWIPRLVTILLILLVLSNDLHQLVFRFPVEYRESGADTYWYGVLYYVIYVWIVILLLATYVTILAKCNRMIPRKYVWVPFFTALVGMIWLVLIACGLGPMIRGRLLLEFPETFCFVIISLWVSCIRIGLIPANKAYDDLFRISSVHAVITDTQDKIVYRSSGDFVVPGQAGESYRIRRKEIRGGYVYWESDVSELNRTREELESIRQQLQEEAQLIRLENERKEKNAAIEAKNAVYDAIAVRVRKQSEQITLLSGNCSDDVSEQQRNLHFICFLGSYIKRMSNLMLIAAEQSRISETELALAMAESLRNLEKLGIHTSILVGDGEESAEADLVVTAYELFQQYTEQLLPHLIGIYAVQKKKDIKLVLECDQMCELPQPAGGAMTEWDDNTAYVTIPLKRGGDEACQ